MSSSLVLSFGMPVFSSEDFSLSCRLFLLLLNFSVVSNFRGNHLNCKRLISVFEALADLFLHSSLLLDQFSLK